MRILVRILLNMDLPMREFTNKSHVFIKSGAAERASMLPWLASVAISTCTVHCTSEVNENPRTKNAATCAKRPRVVLGTDFDGTFGGSDLDVDVAGSSDVQAACRDRLWPWVAEKQKIGELELIVVTGRRYDELKEFMTTFHIPAPSVYIGNVGVTVKDYASGEAREPLQSEIERLWGDNTRTITAIFETTFSQSEERTYRDTGEVFYEIQPQFINPDPRQDPGKRLSFNFWYPKELKNKAESDVQRFRDAVEAQTRVEIVPSLEALSNKRPSSAPNDSEWVKINLDFLPLGINKWGTLERVVREMYGDEYSEDNPLIVTAGDSGNDYDMLAPTRSRGIAVGNSKSDLKDLLGELNERRSESEQVFIAPPAEPGCAGIIAGLKHYRVLDADTHRLLN